MKILHVIPFVSEIYGGPSRAIFEMCRSQNQAGIATEILTTTCSREPDFREYADQSRLVQGVRVHFFKGVWGQYRYALKLGAWLRKNVRSYDLVHIHSIFNYPALATSRWTIHYKIPYIVRTQGILYDWCLKSISRYKKWFYLTLVENKTLKNAASIHFTTDHEKEGCRFEEFKKRCYTLPLGIERQKAGIEGELTDFHEKFPRLKGKKILLYLARLHSIKGLDLFLPAISDLLKKNTDWVFVIAGSGRADYVRSLVWQIKTLGLENRIFMPGHVSGKDKESFLRYSTAFVLPSYSENFGIAVVEAMQAGLPVVVSDRVAVGAEIVKYQAGLVFTLDDEAIRATVQKIMQQEGLREKMSQAGVRLVRDQYDWDRITTNQICIYKELV